MKTQARIFPEIKVIHLWENAHIFPEIKVEHLHGYSLRLKSYIYEKNLFIIQSIWTNIHIENKIHLLPQKMDIRHFNTF